MKFDHQELPHKEFNDKVSGQNATYSCWAFRIEQSHRIEHFTDCIVLESYLSLVSNENGQIRGMKRNYTS